MAASLYLAATAISGINGVANRFGNNARLSFSDDDAIAAFGRVWGELIRRIPGDPWKSSRAVIEEIRKAKNPALLSGVQE